MKTYLYKLYSKSKDGNLDNQIDRFGIVYNHCIALHRRYYKLTGKKIPCYTLILHLTRLKHRIKWRDIFRDLPSQAVQDVAERIDKSYRLFFSNRKRNVKCSPPRFKPVKKYSSYTLKQAGYRFSGNRIRLNGVWYGFHKSRDLKGRIKTVTVKRDRCGDMWIAVVTDWTDSREVPKSGKSVGYDFGMGTFLYASDGRDIEAPLFLKRAEKDNLKVSRSVSHKVEGSNHYRQAVMRKARFQRRLANQRTDFQWKLADRLVREYDILCFEDLNLKGMSRQARKPGKKHGRKRFGRKIGEYGLYSFLNKLTYKAKVCGKEVRKVSRWFPSSQLCSECGYQNTEVKDMKVTRWVCPKCGKEHDRNRNAAINIEKEGTSSFWSGSGKTNISDKGVAA